MKLMVLRHAECSSNLMNPEQEYPCDSENSLTERGINHLLRYSLPDNFPLNDPLLISGPALRAMETATILNERVLVRPSPVVEIWRELEELFSVPAPTPGRDLNKFVLDFWRTFYSSDQTKRAQLSQCTDAKIVIDRVLKSYPRDVVLVSHGGKIELITAMLLGVAAELDRTIEFRLDPGNFHLFDLLVQDGRIAHLRIVHLNG